MAVYQRTTVVAAPLSAVWAFHARIAGLTAVTPAWLGLRVDDLDRPDSPATPELISGTRIRLSVRPFGTGPRVAWTSVIRAATAEADEAVLVDEMVDGPFPRWRHTHRFTAVTGGTRIQDRIEYRLPGGAVGRVVAPLLRIGLAPMFRYRHRRTRTLLGGGGRDDR